MTRIMPPLTLLACVALLGTSLSLKHHADQLVTASLDQSAATAQLQDALTREASAKSSLQRALTRKAYECGQADAADHFLGTKLSDDLAASRAALHEPGDNPWAR